VDYEQYGKEHHLDIRIEDRVAIVRLDRPDKRNAVNHALHRGLENIWKPLGTDPDVGAIVLTGNGKAFCAGGDVVGFYPEDPGPLDQMRGTRWLVQEMINCEAPIIAAVNGAAAGLGATIALLSDVIYMAEDARIGDTHVNMGLVAGDGGAVIWPLLIGPHRAKELLMSGRLVDGREAGAMGLVNHVVPGDELMETATGYARSLAKGPQAAIRWTKLTVNQHLKQSLNAALDVGVAVEHLASETEDCKEAMRAFAEKRQPKFTGR
jgi:enoyl-CoA hydratase/carnithine racemase